MGDGDRRFLSALDLSREAGQRREVLCLEGRFLSLLDTPFIKMKRVGGNVSVHVEDTEGLSPRAGSWR